MSITVTIYNKTFYQNYDDRTQILTYMDDNENKIAEYNDIMHVGYVMNKKQKKLYSQKSNWLIALNSLFKI